MKTLIRILVILVAFVSYSFASPQVIETDVVEAQSCSGQITCCNNISTVCSRVVTCIPHTPGCNPSGTITLPCSPGSPGCSCTTQCHSWDATQSCTLNGNSCQVQNGCSMATGGCSYTPPSGGGGGTPPPPGQPPPPPPTGGWGSCGSCGSCPPGPSSQCVRAPDGSCVWDPGACGGGGSGTCNVNSFSPSPINITVGQSVNLATTAFNGIWQTTANGARWTVGIAANWGILQDSYVRLNSVNTGTSVSNGMSPQTVTAGAQSITGLAAGSTAIWVDYNIYSTNDGAYVDNANCRRMVQVNVTPPVCNSTAPTPPALVAPANNSTISTTTAALQWTQNGGWGNACPTNNNQYRVFLSANCTGPYVQYNGYNSESGGVFTRNISGLSYGTTYCWFVQKYNGSQGANSPVWAFTVGNQSTIDTVNYGADVCGQGYSGRFGNSGVTNPFDFNYDFTLADSTDTVLGAYLTIVPTTGPWAENGNTVNGVTVMQKANSAGGITAATGLVAQGAWVVQNSLAWRGGTPDATNDSGTATVIAAGTGGTMSSATQGNFRFRVRFNNSYPSGAYNLYGAVQIRKADGTVVTTHATSTDNIVFRRIGTWGVDVVNPGVTIGGPTYNSNGTFDITYGATDNIQVLNTANYIFRSAATGAIRDNTISQNLAFTFGPNIHSGSVNTSNYLAQPTRNYTDNGTGTDDSYTFRFDATDRGCNYVNVSALVTQPRPWLMTYQGNVSGNNGYVVNIPDNPTFTVPFTSDTGTPYLSTFGVLAGDTKIPSLRVSEAQTYSTTYNNEAVLPPVNSGHTSWYQYARERVTANQKSTILSRNNNFWIGNGNFSNRVNLPPGSKFIHIVNANLTIAPDTVCDVKALFIVSGIIHVSADQTTLGDNACMFISQGLIEVSTGSTKSPNVPIGSTNAPNYDRLDGFYITDASFNTDINALNPIYKFEGLFINGGVRTQQLELERDLNDTANFTHPAIVIKYDPKYMMIFGEDLAYKTYSLREQL